MSETLFETAWQQLTSSYSEFTLTTVGTWIFHVGIYFLLYLPYYIADFLPALQKYKIQPKKKVTPEMYTRCLKLLFFNYFCVQPLLIVAGHFFLQALGMEFSLPLPSWSKIAVVIVGCFIVEDFYFYWIHRLLHAGFWYKHIHKVHHDHTAPFGLAGEYAHPVETIVLGFGTILGPILFCRHMFVLWVWLFFRVFQEMESHCGYNFPWSPCYWIPFWSGAEFHDYHHETFSGNYSSTFTIWDWVFGTDVKYRQRKQQRRLKERARKNNKRVVLPKQ
eukprot:TRINITY_DN13183_c0_g1_i1.p1 TRINITY_DN13183_c0_g1~~TRINITY_DN13183_c0_g1_i1.p1  ORF type:complete len:276 (-),score=13.35 TRINITY_DN13183_c0_g1_i1:35-862(-)